MAVGAVLRLVQEGRNLHVNLQVKLKQEQVKANNGSETPLWHKNLQWFFW